MKAVIGSILIYLLFLGNFLFAQEFVIHKETDNSFLEVRDRKGFNKEGYFSYGGINQIDRYSAHNVLRFRSFGIFLNLPDTSNVIIKLYNHFRDSSYTMFEGVLSPNLYEFLYNLKDNNLLIDRNALYSVFVEAIEQSKNCDSTFSYLDRNKSIYFRNQIVVRLDTLNNK